MTVDVTPSAWATILSGAAAIQRVARARPLDANHVPGPHLQNVWRLPPAHAVLATVAVERCGCMHGTPLWHASVSVWSVLTRSKVPAEAATRQVAELCLTGAGEARSLWWWNEVANVGHLRAHMTEREAIGVPPSEPASDDHDEAGDWYERRTSA